MAKDVRRKILNSYLMTNDLYNNDYTNEVKNYNQVLLDEEFELLGNVYTINEEKIRGSGIFTPIRASISLVDKVTNKSGNADELRVLSFQNLDYEIEKGKRYEFDNNIWITINSTTIKTITRGVLVKRCNNVLKWYDDESGVLYEEPCILGDKITSTQVDEQTFIQVIQGELSATLQYNLKSKLININQRFIIDGTAYRVTSRNIANRKSTYDKDSVCLMTIDLEIVNKNEHVDDLNNNIANKQDEENVNITLNGNVVTPDIHDLSAFVPYNIGKYEVYNYIDNVRQIDTFEFEFFDALDKTYKVSEVTGNSFTVECLEFSQVPLVVSYRNINTNEINEFIIVLRGVL